MKFCLTGVTGVIGIPLVTYLLTQKHEVVVLLNSESKRNIKIDPHKKLTILFADLDNYSELKATFKCDVFIHMAWCGGNNREHFGENFASCGATVAAVKLAKTLGCKTFISTGSQAECAAYSEVMDENTLCTPKSAFGLAKYAAFKASEIACSSAGIRFIWLRIFSVYGEHDRNEAMLTSLLRASLSGEDLPLSSGEQFWDFLHAQDVVTAIYRLAMNERAAGLYVVGSGEGLTLLEYFEIVSGALGRDLSSSIGALGSDGTYSLRCRPNRLMRDADWRPEIDFNRGIEKMIIFMKKNAH